MWVRSCLDAMVKSIHVVAESLAFLFGIHVVLLLHLLQLATTSSVASERPIHSPFVVGPTATTIPADLAGRHRTQRRTALHHIQPFHLPALEPRPPYGPLNDHTLSIAVKAKFQFWSLQQKAVNILSKMADVIEQRGGEVGKMIVRRTLQKDIAPRLIHKLPPEIASHILLLAASPELGNSIPTKVSLLSKAYYKLVTPKLYACVNLSNASMFRKFRMTMAVRNPRLGNYVNSLSVASSSFDPEGYLPEQVAEHVTLGVGIEQILLTCPNLQHLYLDLFSLAALHHSTASRLEKGSLPITLTTEFSLPQYLSLPTFCHLEHIELTVFGLDSTAVEWFRQVIPHLHSVTLRWVTRKSSLYASRSKRGFSQQWTESDSDLDEIEQQDWRSGGTRDADFKSFVQAIERLRRWPYYSDALHSGHRLDSITIMAWPKAFRELCKTYRTDPQSVCSGLEGTDESSGNQSSNSMTKLKGPDDIYQPDFVFGTRPLLPRAPLRVELDGSFQSGPRRSPLDLWSRKHQAMAWTL